MQLLIFTQYRLKHHCFFNKKMQFVCSLFVKDWLFTVLRPAGESFNYMDVTIAGEGLQI
jgi:hypothetical protein